jgi:hypothetical protein
MQIFYPLLDAATKKIDVSVFQLQKNKDPVQQNAEFLCFSGKLL